ncbi:MAG TPA: CorA family divalent cation transporter [Solirubrobacterales bacterium]|nr:CorA family divalent cation transporter [Solirubrobacterales bacterium]
MAERIRRISAWAEDGSSEVVEISELSGRAGFPWFELACGVENADELMETLGPWCPGLTERMLCDLLTPDEQPEGESYGENIRLASSFAVEAWRPTERTERGRPQGVGVLRFQPVELLAGEGWLITCWHPQRVFQGSRKLEEERPPGEADGVFETVAKRWKRQRGRLPGDLGISIMHELSLTYAPVHRTLHAWLEDWELSLYMEDDLDNHDQLPELWGLMAVFRDWLNPLNKAGLRADPEKAWLPCSDHDAAVGVDDRIDKALAALGRLSDTLRQSFGLLHLEQTEEQRRHGERVQHRVELMAAGFLVPTFIVGLYGANTWVPGQGRHWGFWVMLFVLLVLSMLVVAFVWRTQRRAEAAQEAAAAERRRMRDELLSRPSGATYG